MFYSHCLLSREGPLGSIWVAAYCFQKLKKSQVTSTDISSSVDRILQDEFEIVTYRVLAYLLLGIVRIYSKKVEYLFDDCNKVLLSIRDFVLSNKDGTLLETIQAPYFSITLPERFELDAFDLEILEDTIGGNVLPYEEITLKAVYVFSVNDTDGMWKTRGMGKYSLDQYHCEEFAACEDTWPADYSLNEDVQSSHLMDIDKGLGTLCSVSNLEASLEKLRSNIHSHHECEEDREIFPEVEEEPPDIIKLFGEDHQTFGENSKVQEMIDSDEMHVEARVQKHWNESACWEACNNLETFGGLEEESVNPTIPCHQPHEHIGQTENEVHSVISNGNMSDVEATTEKLLKNRFSREECIDSHIFSAAEEPPEHARQRENEVHSVISSGNMSDVEATREKLLENRFSREEGIDSHIFSVAEEPPEHARPVSEKHQSDAENTFLSETTVLGKRKCQGFSEDNPLSIKLDATPQSKSHGASGANMPEFSLIATPIIKERAQILRKRKYLLDDVIVFPNNIVKQCLEDASDLVSKRRKVPCTAHATWKSFRLSNLNQCFLEPLIPCTSLELRSLFYGKRVHIPKTVESAGRPVETENPSKKLCVSEPHIVGRSVETTECLEKLNVSESPTVDRLDVTAKPLEAMMIPESVRTRDFSQKFVFESPAVARSVDSVDPSNRSESHTVGRTVETVDPLEKLNVSILPTAGTFAEALDRSGNLGIAESPIAGGSLEETAIAPETPIQCTTSLRSFESPERPDLFNEYGSSFRLESVQKEPSPSKEQELDLNLLNEEMNTSEGDSQDHYGWSERTRVAVKCLHKSFMEQKRRRQEEVVNLLRLVEGRTKKESARLFYEILVLKSRGYVHVKQENSYGDILISKASQWDQACGL